MSLHWFIVVPLFTVIACKTVRKGGDESALHYSIMNHPKYLLLNKVREPKLKICVTGNKDTKIELAKQKTQQAINLWLAPLKKYFQGIANEIEFTCTEPHSFVTVLPGAYTTGSAGTQGGKGYIFQIYDEGPLGSYLHEWGHALVGLGDTYVRRTAGACQEGQERSVMCHGHLLNDITRDDIRGLFAQYRALGFNVDPNGDGDGDGIINGKDKCPFTPEGANIFRDEADAEGREWLGCTTGEPKVQIMPNG